MSSQHFPTAGSTSAYSNRYRDPRYRASTSAYITSTPLETVPETTTPTTSRAILAAASSTTTTTSADMASATATWSAPMGSNQQQNYLPVTSSEVPCCDGHTQYNALAPAWSSPLPQRSDDTTRPPSMLTTGATSFGLGKHGLSDESNYMYYPLIDPAGSWNQKPYDDQPLEFYPFDPDAPIGQAYTTDEAVPIIDLRFSHQSQELNSVNKNNEHNRRSASSMTTSTCGPISEMPATFEEFAANMTDASSFSEYPDISNRTSLMSSAHISPMSSPRGSVQGQSRQEQVRSQSRAGRMSSSPRPSSRVSPYSLDSHRSGNLSRWSTGSHASVRSTPYGYGGGQDLPTHRFSLQPSSMPLSSFPGANLGFQRPHVYTAGSLLSQTQPMGIPMTQSLLPEPPRLPQAPTLASHGLLRMLQSNDAYSLRNHFADFADPPDLFASLNEEPSKPPPGDMNPADPEMVPYEQDVRFEGDLYTPMLVRGHGNKREGWCGMCKPGRWLVLKNSAYWYDKSFTHGISAATGQPFQEPLDKRRMDGNPDVWEGLCGSCNEWIALVSSKKKGTTWFRHAYKCHTHAKVKDVAKRRRDNHPSKLGGSPHSSTSALKESDRSAPRASFVTSAPMLPLPRTVPMQSYMHTVHPPEQLGLPVPGQPGPATHLTGIPVTTSMAPYPNLI